MIKKFFRFLKLAFVILFLASLGALVYVVLPIFGVGVQQDFNKNVLINISKKDDVSHSLYLAHFGEIGQNVKVYKLDENKKIDLPIGEYGEYELKSVVRLLEIDKKDEEYILATFSRTLGFAVNKFLQIELSDDLLKVNGVGVAEGQESEESLIKSQIFWQQAISDLKSFKILSARENFGLYYKFKDLEVLSEEKFMAKKDNYQVITMNESSFCNIAVINATDKNGLATEFADYLENSGATVVKIDNTSEKFKQNTFYFDDSNIVNNSDGVDQGKSCEFVMQKISGIFTDSKNRKPISELKDSSQYRAKMVIFVAKE